MNQTPKCSGAGFRFNLRTLFVVVTIAGAVAGWVSYQLNWIKQRHDIFTRHTIYEIRRKVVFSQNSPQRQPPWSLRLFGEAGQDGMLLDLAESDSELQRIRRLFPEAEVRGRSLRKGNE